MASSNNDGDDDMMEAVNLSNSPTASKDSNKKPIQMPDSSAVYSKPVQVPESSRSNPANSSWDDEDDNVGLTGNMDASQGEEEEVTAEEAEKKEALSKLRASTSNFGKALSRASITLDEKVGFTKGVSQVADKVKTVDEQHLGVGSGAKKAGSWFSSSVSSINQKFQISDKTSQLSGVVQEKVVKPLGKEDSVLQKSKRNLQQLDDSRGITKTTASGLASGMDFLTKSIKSIAPQGDEDDVNDDGGRNA